ncbi:MAG: indolepyruvate oxidoreductase subunit beta [Spirochaetes bacterium]|nr:indolepyruvate oxidoreductase subunit beta [Spirochaetota bacterium]
MANVIFAGVGGQGVILASKILLEVAKNAGYDVKEAEVHGMAQRGGSVDCHVRYSKHVYSPLIEKGTADFVVSFELLESMRKLEYLSDEGILLVNNFRQDPAPVEAGLEKYPEDLESWLSSNVRKCYILNIESILKEIGNRRIVNIVMLGALSNFLEFGLDEWKKAIETQVKEKYVEMNIAAFVKGREYRLQG